MTLLRPLPVPPGPRPVLRLAAEKNQTAVALDLERLIDRHVSRGTDGCLLWQGKVNNRGLPFVTIGKTSRALNRLQYVRHHGPVPKGLVVTQSCRRKRCLEPAHLVAREKNWHL